jgi:hypothetical protein
MADLVVVEELQVFLVAQAIGQLPSAAPSLSLPSVWTLPRDGAPLPRDGENATITLRDPIIRLASEMEAWVEEAFVDVIVRARQARVGKLLQRRMLELIVPYTAPGGHYQWMMGALLVEQSVVWRGDQEMPQRQRVTEGDPHATYDRVASYRFRCRRKILAGLTLP